MQYLASLNPEQRAAVTAPLAITDNAINSALSDNALWSDLVPGEVREIIRFQAKVEALAALIRDGQVTNIAKAIERVFGCTRNSRPDSPYQRARRALEPLVQTGPQYPPLDDDQRAVREELGLPHR